LGKIELGGHPNISPVNIAKTTWNIHLIGRVTKGPSVKEFEGVIADFYDADYAISTGSGTTAIMCLFLALRKDFINEGQPWNPVVSIPAFTFYSVPEALFLAGWDSSFEDIDRDTYHMKDIFEYTNVVMPMDTFGSVSKIDFPDAFTVYDASQSFGVVNEVRGTAEILSFNGGKVFTTGEGGMVITNDGGLASEVKRYRNMLSRMPELSAALGLDFMDKLDDILDQRLFNSYRYELDLADEFNPQTIPIDSNNYIYAVTHPQAKMVMRSLKDELDLRQYYNPPLFDRPNATWVANNHFCIPNGYNTPVDDVIDMLNSVNDQLKDEEG
jgi:dTDP-4-amino-4,6-dideoxygalactose transaminase